MSLLWMDGFDHYSGVKDNMIKAGYINQTGNNNHVLVRSGRTHDWCLQVEGSLFLLTPKFADSQTIIVGLAFNRTSFGTNNDNNNLFALMDEDGTLHATVRIRRTTSAVLQILRGSTVLATGTTVINSDTWYYVEAKITISNTVGAYQVKLNGTDELGPATNQNTRGGSANDVVRYIGLRSINDIKIDDLYVLNTSGSRLNNFIGDRRIYLLTPDADGDTNDYSIAGPAPSRWTALQGGDVENDKRAESYTEDNAHYIQEESAAGTQYFRYPSLHGDVVGIEAVRAISYQKKSLPGVCTSRLKCDSNGSIIDGSTFYPVVEGSWDSLIVEDDPDTSAAWTISGLDAAQFGVERLT